MAVVKIFKKPLVKNFTNGKLTASFSENERSNAGLHRLRRVSLTGYNMRLFRTILASVLWVWLSVAGLAAEHGEVAAAAHEHAEHAESHGLPPAAPVFQVGPIQFTSSMVVTWTRAGGAWR